MTNDHRLYRNDEIGIMLAPESTSELNGRVVLRTGDEVRMLDYDVALELSSAILDQTFKQGGDPGRCGGCDKPILWIKTIAGRPTPCNPDIQQIVTVDGKVVRGYTNHFSTCPNADDFRREARSKPKRAPKRAPITSIQKEMKAQQNRFGGWPITPRKEH